MTQKLSPEVRKNLNKYLPYIISAITILIVSVIYINILNSAQEEIVTYKTEEGQEIYFYIGEGKFEYTSQITMSSENQYIKLTTGDYEHYFDSEPIYFKNKKQVLFSGDMSLVMTKNGFVQKRINKFTRILIDGSYYIQDKSLNYAINNGFLFDGNDLYFFLNETEIYVGNTKYVLPPFSYVVYNFNDELYMYNYNEDKMTVLKRVTDDVLAKHGDYTINLGIDGIIHNDGSKLLMKNFDYLKKLEQND